MNLTHLTQHPEELNKETLYQLRELVARYPYYQTARLLMLQNLYLLHDSSFDDELRRSAIYITDRKVLFNLVEAAHYQTRNETTKDEEQKEKTEGNRTIKLIDKFLHQTPQEEQPTQQKGKRQPTSADATIDYVAYLLQMENEDPIPQEEITAQEMKGQELIDNFINKEGGRIQLKNEEEEKKQNPAPRNEDTPEEGIYTETMAKIYIKQGRYSKAIEIITQLNLDNPKKNIYFADQLRFLEKLVLNNKTK